MKILNLSLDKQLLQPGSSVCQRLSEYGSFVEKLTVVVPDVFTKDVTLSSRVKVVGSGGTSKLHQLFLVYQKARTILRAERYSLITAQDIYFLGLVGFILSASFKLPLEVQVHGFEKESFFRLSLARFVLRQADGIRVVSQRLKRELLADFKIKESKIVVIPIYSPEAHQERPAKDYTAHQPFTFVTVGRLVPVKNIALQLRALADVVKTDPGVTLVIAGDGPDRPYLMSLTSSLGLEDHVTFTGQLTDVSSVYKEADVFLLTSKREGWGMVIIEAASFGLPIIMTDVGCAGEVIKNRESGLVIPVGSHDSLVDAMKEIRRDSILRQQLGTKARSAVFNLPSRDQIYRAYEQSWRALTNL